MLERAAAGFETGKLQRALPRSARLSQRSRNLRSGFSKQHEPFRREVPCSPCSSVSAKSHSPDTDPLCRSPDQRAESTLLLEFLYPRPTHALLRQNGPGDVRPHLHPKVSGREGGVRSPSDCRSNSTVAIKSCHDATDGIDEAAASLQAESLARFARSEGFKESHWNLQDSLIRKEQLTIASKVKLETTVDNAAQIANRETSRSPISPMHTTKQSIERLLGDAEGTQYRDVWDLYCRLDQSDRIELRPRIVSYLAKSQSVVEMGRAMSLVRQIEVSEWNDEFLSSAVLILLRSGDQDAAIQFFKSGLDAKGLAGGFEYLLLDTANRQQWPALLDVWSYYYQNCSKPSSGKTLQPDEELLAPLSSLSSLGALYFSFERYLAGNEGHVKRDLEAGASSWDSLRLLRRRFAEEALSQPCPPKQASTILAFWRDPILYDRYLTRLFDHWYRKKATTATARMLPDIYKEFRKLPGAKPSHAVLRGIFKVHYPNGAAALEQLKSDWVRYWGELSHWAFEKFLKFYAQRGDVHNVKQLWSQYVELYPSRLQSPRGFRSIMNVYAQNGDVEGAEKEFGRIINEYKVEPDLDLYNTLLKCYMRANDYSKVLSCFDDISSLHKPDSFTYAHVMAMAAKNGDLETTIEFFHAAEANQVNLSREMGLSLVVAYCQNDGLAEAENICLELAQRGVSSTAIWNQLLHFNGMAGRLRKCYELLNGMKRFGLSWDQETIACLLRALVRVKQTAPAFSIVRDASKNRLHALQPDHFAIVMSGAVRIGDRHTAENLMNLMETLSIPIPFNARVAYAQIALQTAPNAVQTPALAKDMLASLRSLAAEYPSGTGNIRRREHETSSIGRAVRLLVEFREFGTVEELITTFQDMFPKYKTEEALPQDVIASLMYAYHRDGNYEQVHKLWRAAWPQILKRCTKSDGKGIYTAHQYDVTMIIFRMAQTFTAQKDGEGLATVVGQVIQAGFKLSSSTWDRVLKTLATFGQWEVAMDWCESFLMPQWRGWQPYKPTLSARRQAMNPRLLRPTASMVLTLQRTWMETRKLAAWSGTVSRKLLEMEDRYPLLHNAFLTSDSWDESGPWVFNTDVDLEKSIPQLLTPLPLKELRHMKKVLEKQLKIQRKQAKKGQGESPFRLFDTIRDGSSTTAMRQAELQQLRAVLSKTLSEKEENGLEEENEPMQS